MNGLVQWAKSLLHFGLTQWWLHRWCSKLLRPGGRLYLSTQEGKAGFACVSDATGATMEYPAGTRFQTGDNVCRLRKNGKVKCENKAGGYGFTVGQKTYDVF